MDTKKSRPLLLAGEIIAIVVFSCSVFFYAIYAYALLIAGALTEGFTGSVADTTEIFIMIYYLFGLMLASVVGLIITSVACASANAPIEKFNKRQGLLITSIVLTLLIVLASLLGVLVTNFISLVIVVALIVAAVLMSIGLGKGRADAKKIGSEQPQNIETNTQIFSE